MQNNLSLPNSSCINFSDVIAYFDRAYIALNNTCYESMHKKATSCRDLNELLQIIKQNIDHFLYYSKATSDWFLRIFGSEMLQKNHIYVDVDLAEIKDILFEGATRERVILIGTSKCEFDLHESSAVDFQITGTSEVRIFTTGCSTSSIYTTDNAKAEITMTDASRTTIFSSGESNIKADGRDISCMNLTSNGKSRVNIQIKDGAELNISSDEDSHVDVLHTGDKQIYTVSHGNSKMEMNVHGIFSAKGLCNSKLLINTYKNGSGRIYLSDKTHLSYWEQTKRSVIIKTEDYTGLVEEIAKTQVNPNDKQNTNH